METLFSSRDGLIIICMNPSWHFSEVRIGIIKHYSCTVRVGQVGRAHHENSEMEVASSRVNLAPGNVTEEESDDGRPIFFILALIARPKFLVLLFWEATERSAEIVRGKPTRGPGRKGRVLPRSIFRACQRPAEVNYLAHDRFIFPTGSHRSYLFLHSKLESGMNPNKRRPLCPFSAVRQDGGCEISTDIFCHRVQVDLEDLFASLPRIFQKDLNGWQFSRKFASNLH